MKRILQEFKKIEKLTLRSLTQEEYVKYFLDDKYLNSILLIRVNFTKSSNELTQLTGGKLIYSCRLVFFNH